LNNSLFAKIAIWAVIALVLFTVFRQLEHGAAGSVRTIAYSEFLDQVHQGHIKSARLQDAAGGNLDITAQTDEGTQIHTTGSFYDRGLFKDLFDNKVRVELEPHEQPSPLLSFFYAFGPVILLIGVWIFFMADAGRRARRRVLVRQVARAHARRIEQQHHVRRCGGLR